MGFKIDTSFLRFLTMGALGARQVAAELRGLGFEPIELERYGTSNKIWATKVKRLRLPDALCVRTGLRVEIRAKSDLKIRMSDAPNNPERAWDAGMRAEDVVALIACADDGGGPVPAQRAVYFTVDALRRSVAASTFGSPKSASEGAERDRTWPSIVPSRPGQVQEVTPEKLIVLMQGDGEAPRRQTYTLNGKHPYVASGDWFDARSSILAGSPAETADLASYLARAYSPLEEVGSERAIDRFAAVKALRFRPDLRDRASVVLEQRLEVETEARVALEAAGSAAALGSAKGEAAILAALHADERADLSMESILILTELRSAFARQTLAAVASNHDFANDERRQAAIWGLGKSGLKAYSELLPYIADAEDNVGLHAVAAFGEDAPVDVVRSLIKLLNEGDLRKAPAASEALRVIGSELVLEELVAAATSGGASNWIIATLGRLSPELVRGALAGDPLLLQLEPMLLIAHGSNWLSSEEAVTDLAFLMKQNL